MRIHSNNEAIFIIAVPRKDTTEKSTKATESYQVIYVRREFFFQTNKTNKYARYARIYVTFPMQSLVGRAEIT